MCERYAKEILKVQLRMAAETCGELVKPECQENAKYARIKQSIERELSLLGDPV